MGGQSTDVRCICPVADVYTDQQVKMLVLIPQHQFVTIPVSGCGVASVGHMHGEQCGFPAKCGNPDRFLQHLSTPQTEAL